MGAGVAAKDQLIEKQRLYDEWKSNRDTNLSTNEDDVSHETPADTQMSEEYRRKAEENRRKYPELAAFVDEVRKHFPGARVVSIKPMPEREAPATRELIE